MNQAEQNSWTTPAISAATAAQAPAWAETQAQTQAQAQVQAQAQTQAQVQAQAQAQVRTQAQTQAQVQTQASPWASSQAPTPMGSLPPYTVVQGQKPQPVPETEETRQMKRQYGFIAPAAFAYAVFYAFCMYRNGSGITFPFFVGSSLLFFGLSFSRLGIIIKKGSGFYAAAMILLGISTFCTDDGTIIFFNKLGVFLLLMSLLLKQCCDTSKWKLGKYLGSICVLVFASLGELGRPVLDGAAYSKSDHNHGMKRPDGQPYYESQSFHSKSDHNHGRNRPDGHPYYESQGFHSKNREKKTDKRVLYFGLGLLVGIPMLLVVLLLLASADAVFRQMTERLLQSISIGGIINVLFRITVLFFGSYALVAYLCKRNIREEVTERRNGEPVLAITVTGLLTLLYLWFSGIQIAGLFLGKLQLPEGYTYAMYAREGFFQLLAVSLLNLVIVLFCLGFFRESKVLKGVLTVMSLCTFVMIASSAMRMIMYIRYYYLTYLRILVLWALVLLALLFAGVIVNIFVEGFPLFRYQMAVVAVLYLALSFAHPDYIIAKVNLANAPENQGDFFLTEEPYQDYWYLRGLSADAAPVLIPYLKEQGYDMEAFYAKDAADYVNYDSIGAWDDSVEYSRSGQKDFGYYWLRGLQQSTRNFGIRTYNVSRHVALRMLKE